MSDQDTAGDQAVEEVLANVARLQFGAADELESDCRALRARERDAAFHKCFHRLAMHDVNALNTLVAQEVNFAAEVYALIASRDADLKAHESSAGSSMQLDDFEAEREKIMQNYGCQLDALKSLQCRQFRQLVDELYEKSSENLCNVIVKPLQSDSSPPTAVPQFLSESFTIYLGTQMKTMHHVRLTTCDPISLELQQNTQLDASARLETAIFLYGNRLSGVLQVVDQDIDFHLRRRTDLYKACERSAELHFDSLEYQLLKIKRITAMAERKLGDFKPDNYKHMEQAGVLRVGDIYVTRHSNLSSCHAVFHLVADSDVQRSEITSRHPSIHALRNVVRMCHGFGVCSLAIPLLLIDDLSDHHTEVWCLRRAELVFKCIKGYMIECAKYASTPEHTIHFVLPNSVYPSLFRQCAEMISSIFQTTRPLIA